MDGLTQRMVDYSNPPKDPDWRASVYRPGAMDTGVPKRPPRKQLRDEILDRQANRCLYCDREFSSEVSRRGKPVVLRLEWDHFIPHSYSGQNKEDNWVAACHVCNRIKGSLIFSSVDAAVDFILPRRHRKGYR